MSAPEQSAGKPADPFITVVKGSPSDEDLAALVVVLSAAGGGEAPARASVPRDDWGAPRDRLRPDCGLPTSYLNRG